MATLGFVTVMGLATALAVACRYYHHDDLP